MYAKCPAPAPSAVLVLMLGAPSSPTRTVTGAVVEREKATQVTPTYLRASSCSRSTRGVASATSDKLPPPDALAKAAPSAVSLVPTAEAKAPPTPPPDWAVAGPARLLLPPPTWLAERERPEGPCPPPRRPMTAQSYMQRGTDQCAAAAAEAAAAPAVPPPTPTLLPLSESLSEPRPPAKASCATRSAARARCMESDAMRCRMLPSTLSCSVRKRWCRRARRHAM